MLRRSCDHGSGNHSGACFERLESRLLLSAQPPAVRVSILATEASAAETVAAQPPDTGTFTIYRKTASGDAVTAGDLTVKFTRSGTASFGPTKDYILSVGGTPLTATSVLIPNGQDHVDILLSPIGDSLAESAEKAVLTLATNAAYSLTATVANRKATVNISDNTPVITAAILDGVAREQGSDPASFRLTRTGYAGRPLTVKISLSGTAKIGVDYETVPLTATFAPGDATTDVVITPKTDDVPEVAETVVLKLKAGTGYKVGSTDSVQVSVQDDLALADYFPTPMGTWWHSIGKTGSKTLDAVRRIFSYYTIDGLVTTELRTEAGIGKQTKSFSSDYFVVTGNGLAFVQSSYPVQSGPQSGNETQTYSPPLLTIPALFQLGTIFTGQADYTSMRATSGFWTGTDTRTMTVASKVEKVVVPFGTYSALKVTFNDVWRDTDGWHGTTTQTYWLAKGIGPIKVTSSSSSADKNNHNATSSSYSASLHDWSGLPVPV